MKTKLKSLQKIILFTFILLTARSGTLAHAAWNDNAVDYVNTYGETVQYSGGYFYYAQYGTAGSTSTARYSTIGFKTKATVNGLDYGFESKVGGTFEIEDERTSGSYIYTLWRIPYNKAISRLKEKYPTVDLSQLSSKSVNTVWTFDAIMTYRKPNSNTMQGSIDDYGRHTGTIYTTANALINNGQSWATVSQNEIRALFGIKKTVTGSTKPNPVYPTLAHFSVRNYDYANGSTYWVKPTTKVRVVAETYIGKNYGVFPEAMYLHYYKGNYSDGNILTHYQYNGTNGGVTSLSGNVGTINVDKTTSVNNTSSSTSANYLTASFYATFPDNNSTYGFRWTSGYNNLRPAYLETNVKLKVDGTGPSISGASNVGWTNASSTSISVSASDSGSGLASVKLYKNGTLLSGTTHTNTSTGTSTFKVEATDNVGNVSTSTFTHNVDRTIPTAKISATKDVWTKTDIPVTITAADTQSGVKTIQYKASGATTKSWTTYSAKFNVSANGKTVITARSIDNAGNYSSETAVNIYVDKLNPSAQISTTKDVWTKTDIPVTITPADTLSGIKTTQYKASGAVNHDWGTYNGPFAVNVNGKTTITARTLDNAGNYSSETAANLYVDKVLPTTTITGTDKSWKNTNISVSLSGTDGNSGVKNIRYKASGAAVHDWTTYGTPITIDKNGKTTITAQSLDNAGNYATEVSKEFWKDSEKPTIAISTTEKTWKSSPISVTLSATDGFSGVSKTQYKLSGATVKDWSDYTTALSINANGKTIITARSLDNAGNYSNEKTAEVWFDNGKPTIAINTTPSVWKNTPISVTITGADTTSSVSKIQYKLSGATTKEWNDYTTALSINANGKTLITARSIDSAGNYSNEVSSEVWFDNVKPTISIQTTPNVWKNSPITATLSATDGMSGVSTIQYKLTGATVKDWSDYTSTISVSAHGKTTITSRSIDRANNYSSDSSSEIWIDTAKPTVAITTTPSTWKPTDIKATITAVDITSGVNLIQYKLSGATTKDWTTYAGEITVSASGKTSIVARSIDNANNYSSEAIQEAWIDKVKPTGTFSTEPETITREINVDVKSLVDTHSGVKEVWISNDTNFTTPSKYPIVGKSSETFKFVLDKKVTIEEHYSQRTLYIRLYDMVGNYTTHQLKTIVNPAPPESPLIITPSNLNSVYIRGEMVNIKWSHKNGVNDFILPQTKAEITVYNEDTKKERKINIVGNDDNFTLLSLEDGQYTIKLETYNMGPYKSKTSTTKFRYHKFQQDGLVRTIKIEPQNNIKYLLIETILDMPKGTIVEGKLYYKTDSNGKTDYSSYIPFKVDLDNKNEMIRLPSLSSSLQIDLALKNISSPKDEYLTPILDNIKVFAR